MSGSGLLGLGVGFMCFTRALLILVLAYGMIGGMAAARRAAPPMAKPIRRAARNTVRFSSGSAPRLDRIAAAVEVAESSDGTNPRMRHADLAGPQGPMQISAVAAIAIGGGNRFNQRENLVLGRAYLAYMHRRYGNWVDAIAAYNWGPGHMDAWLHEGRRTDRLPPEVARYTGQVLLASARPRGRLPDPGVNASRLRLAWHRSASSPRMRRISGHEDIARAERAFLPAGAGKIRMTPPVRRIYSRRRREYKRDAFARSQDLALRKRRVLHDRLADNERSRFIPAHAQRARGTRLRRHAEMR